MKWIQGYLKRPTVLIVLGVLAAALAFRYTSYCNNSKTQLLPILLGGGESGGEIITAAAIPGVAIPVRGQVPSIPAIETAQYTGNVTWTPNDSSFAPRTVYTALIVLAAKEGYTFKGVPANFFTVPGATATNDSGSGAVVARFPETGAASDIDVSFMSATQTGGSSGTADSTGLFLIFDKTPGTLTTDNITVTGATKGLLSSPGTTMYLGISNITVASGATVAVTITSPSGYATTGSPQTAVVHRRLDSGMEYLGGKLAYILQPGDPGYDAGQVHGLIAATVDQSAGICWISGGSTPATSVPGGTGTALGTGSVNTDRIFAQAVAEGNSIPTSYAAGIARACNAGGYSDWYLPSKDELDKLYTNRHAIGGFAAASYWSSSEIDAGNAWFQFFSDGTQSGTNKCWWAFRVRAVRSF